MLLRAHAWAGVAIGTESGELAAQIQALGKPGGRGGVPVFGRESSAACWERGALHPGGAAGNDVVSRGSSTWQGGSQAAWAPFPALHPV